MRFVFMYFFFGDESKIDSIFSLALYGVKQENVEKIESLVLDFIKINSLPKNYEFRYHSDSSLINQKFRSFIIEKLIQTRYIDCIYFAQVNNANEPFSHINTLEILIPLIAELLNGIDVRFILDNLGGKTTEAKLKTELNRLCKKYNINLKKSLVFNQSNKSHHLMIADYIVALKRKNIL